MDTFDKVKVRFVLFDWGGTLGKSGRRKDFLWSPNMPSRCNALQEGTMQTLKCLHRMSIPMGILSNTEYTKRDMDRALKETGLSKFFILGLYSSDPGMCRKPCINIFYKALSIIQEFIPNIRPSEVLYVGNNYIADIYGANAAGFKTAYLTHDNPFKAIAVRELGIQTFVLKNISDLCDVIPAFNNKKYYYKE